MVASRIAHRHDHPHLRAKLTMNGVKRRQMAVAAIAGVADQNGQRRVRRFFMRARRVRAHTGGEIKQRRRRGRVTPPEIVDIAAGGEYLGNPPLRQSPQPVKPAPAPAAGFFIQIGPPDVPVSLSRADTAAQQRQPQPGVKLAVKKETSRPILTRQRHHGARQRFLVSETRYLQRRIGLLKEIGRRNNHEPPYLMRRQRRRQRIVKETQHRLVMVGNIRPQDMNQCGHARLQYRMKTPQHNRK